MSNFIKNRRVSKSLNVKLSAKEYILVKIHDKFFDDYLSSEEISTIVKKIAAQLNEDYTDFGNVVVIGVLNGAIPFFKDLIFHLPSDLTMDFIKCSSYGAGTKSSGRVKLVLDNQLDITGKDVIIVEDIVDSGLTQQFLIEHFRLKEVKSVKVCSLFYKSVNNKTGRVPDYFGLDIPDYFIVGYGLDYAHKGRNIDKILKIVED